MTDTETHANTVNRMRRDLEIDIRDCRDSILERGYRVELEALDWLVARITELEQQLAILDALDEIGDWRNRAEAAEARADRNDELMRRAEAKRFAAEIRAARAEARAKSAEAATEEALRRVLDEKARITELEQQLARGEE
jgi:hypothetical protein